MSENDNGPVDGADGGQQGAEPDKVAQAPDFEPITSQEALDKVLGKRLDRERAKFADYEQVKAKAAKLDQIERSKMDEIDRYKADLASVTAERDAAKFESVRTSVAASKGVPASSLTGKTREELEASADELIAWRAAGKATPQQKITTATSGGGNKSGVTANGGSPLSPKALAAERLRQMRNGD